MAEHVSVYEELWKLLPSPSIKALEEEKKI